MRAAWRRTPPPPRRSAAAGAANAPSGGTRELIAETASRLHDVGAELAPQPHHLCLDRIRVARLGGAVEMFGQLTGGNSAIGMVGKVVEKTELERRQRHRPAVERGRHAPRVEFEPAAVEQRR